MAADECGSRPVGRTSCPPVPPIPLRNAQGVAESARPGEGGEGIKRATRIRACTG